VTPMSYHQTFAQTFAHAQQNAWPRRKPPNASRAKVLRLTRTTSVPTNRGRAGLKGTTAQANQGGDQCTNTQQPQR
jgi:hypothetical protein